MAVALRNLLFLSLVFNLNNYTFAKTKCSSVFATSLNDQGSRDFLYSYSKMILTEGDAAVDRHWLPLVNALIKSDRSLFLKILPRQTFPEIDQDKNLKAPYLSSANYGIRKEGPKNKIVPFKSRLYHLTSESGSNVILSGSGLKLGGGVRNVAAICLGGGGFPKYRNWDANPQNVMLEVILRPNAKILDLTHYMESPSSVSYFGTYLWYRNEFVKKFISGRDVESKKIREMFPELAFEVTRLKRSGVDRTSIELLLSSPEFFGLWLGADVLSVSERYEQNFFDEYWVINPDAMSKVKVYGHAI